MMLDLIKMGLGATIGGVATFIVVRHYLRQWYEQEAYASYLVGRKQGQTQGQWDTRRSTLYWEKN